MATGPAIRRITQGGRFPQRSVTAVHSRHVDPSVQTDAGPARARATIRGVVWLQALANGLGVIAVWAYFAFLLPGSEGGRMESSTINLVAFGTYTAVMVLLALPVNALLLRNPSVVNFMDGCALSLPCHAAGDWPVGLMLFAPAMADDRLLAAAAFAESVLPVR